MSFRFKLTAAFLLVSLLAGIFVVVMMRVQITAAERAAMLEAEHVANAIAITGIENPLESAASVTTSCREFSQVLQARYFDRRCGQEPGRRRESQAGRHAIHRRHGQPGLAATPATLDI